MLPVLTPTLDTVPAIVVAMNPETTQSAAVAGSTDTKTITSPAAAAAPAAPNTSIKGGMVATMNDTSALAEGVRLDVSCLDLSDTGGIATGLPDSSPIQPVLIEDTASYLASDLTIHGLGADVYMTWSADASQWLMNIFPMGGMAWTGLGGTDASDPTGIYYTSPGTEAGSGYVVVTA